MKNPKVLEFQDAADAHDELVERGYYRFARNVYQHRYNGKTAHISVGHDGSASVNII